LAADTIGKLADGTTDNPADVAAGRDRHLMTGKRCAAAARIDDEGDHRRHYTTKANPISVPSQVSVAALAHTAPASAGRREVGSFQQCRDPGLRGDLSTATACSMRSPRPDNSTPLHSPEGPYLRTARPLTVAALQRILLSKR
jgi:hypothetical protein